MNRVLRFWLFPVLLMFAAVPAMAQLTGGFTASTTSGCIGLVVTFTADTAGSPTNFVWNLGNGSSPANASTVTTTYNTAGPYNVSLTASNSSGSANTSKSAYITIYANPLVSFIASPTTGCVGPTGLTVNFTSTVTPNSPGQESYDWDFGDATTHSSSANPQHVYTQSGTYGVSLTVTNYAGCSKTFFRNLYIKVNANPVASFTVSPLNYACTAPATFTFTNTTSGSGPYNVTWFWGDATPNTPTSNLTQSHSYSTGGNYPVRMVLTDANGCVSDTARDLVSLFSGNASFTTAPSSKCVNAAVTFTNTTVGGTNTVWDYGDGVSDNLGVHAYTVAGTYTVKLTTNIGPCPKTAPQSITINPNPVPTVTFSPDRPCPGSSSNPSPVTFTATTNPPGATVTWTDFGDGQAGVGSPITHNYTSLGYKTIKIKVSALGCDGTAELTDLVPINGLIPKLSSDAGCIGVAHTFSVELFGTLPPLPPPALPPYPDTADSYNWTFSDPPATATSTLSHPTYTWNNVGTYNISVSGTTPNGVGGCHWSTTATYHTDTKVPPNFTASPVVVCPKDTVRFLNLTVLNTVPNTKYNWSTGDSSFTTQVWTPGFYYLYRTPGTFTPTLKTDHNGCIDTISRPNYITVHPPNAAFSFLVDCPPAYKAYFTDMSIGATSWLWDFGDGSAVTAANSMQNPQHSYAAVGVYNVKLHTANSMYGCSDEVIHPVTVFDPILNITADKTIICLGEEINFTGSFIGVGSATYSWVFDSDPPTAFSGSPVLAHTFTTRGFHSVKLLVNYGNSCQAFLLKTNYILASRPIVNFSGTPPIGCRPVIVNFTDASTATINSTIIGRDWSFGDASYNKGNNAISPPPHVYSVNGIFDVVLTVTDSKGCKDSLVRSQYIRVRRPAASFNASRATICVHSADTFTNFSTGVTPLSYYWDFGDGTIIRTNDAIHAYAAAGIYQVKMAATDSTPCADTAKLTITVLGPVASFTKNKSAAICPPLVVSFNNTSVGASIFSWNMGNGATPLLTFAPQNYTYNVAGKYVIALTATDVNGCSDIAKDSVFVLGDSSSFSFTPANGCVPQTVTFTAVVDSIPKITWDFNDGTVITVFNTRTITHTYSGTGPYYPIAYFSDGTPNCNTPAPSATPIRLDKIKAAFTNSVPCVGVPFTLRDASTAVYNNPNAWQWVFAPADSAAGASVSHAFASAGLHPVTLIATNSWGCKDTVTRNIYINPLPNIDAGPIDTGICPGDQIMLIAHGGVSYTWGPSNLVSCVACDTTLVSSAAPTTYYVTGIDTNGCINKDSIVAHIQIKTTTSVKPGGDICIGESFRLEAAGATIYNWSPERFVDSPHISSPLATPITTTTFVLEAQEGTCLVHYDTLTVVVHPTPFFDAGPDELINYGSSVVLHPTKAGISSIQWRQDSTLSCLSCFDPVAHPSYSNIYYARATSEYGCVATDSVIVRVRCNGDSVFIPNTFTPNGDGLNDYFYPRGKGVDHMSSFRIYNRWGELVFEHYTMPLNDEKSGWDGTFKGKQLPPDVYVYTMSTRCESGEPVSWKGDITLIR